MLRHGDVVSALGGTEASVITRVGQVSKLLTFNLLI